MSSIEGKRTKFTFTVKDQRKFKNTPEETKDYNSSEQLNYSSELSSDYSNSDSDEKVNRSLIKY